MSCDKMKPARSLSAFTHCGRHLAGQQQLNKLLTNMNHEHISLNNIYGDSAPIYQLSSRRTSTF